MHLRAVETLRDPDLWAAFELYIESFPDRTEREPLGSLAHWFDPAIPCEPIVGGTRTLVVAKEGERLAGFTWFSVHDECDLAYLRYIAVDPAFRRCGVAGLLFQDVVARVGGRTLMLEVERVELAVDDDDRARREGRLAFFRSMGATWLSGNYVQPSMGPDRAAAPLNLLALIGSTPAPAAARAFLTRCMGYDENDPVVIQTLADVNA